MSTLLRGLRPLLLVGCGLLLALAALPAQAQKTYGFPKEKPIVTITAPEGWAEKEYSDDYFGAATKGDAAEIGLWMLKKSITPQQALDTVDEELKRYLKDIMVKGDKQKLTFDDMPVAGWAGTAKDKETGEPLEWQFYLIGSDPEYKSIYAFLYYGEVGATAKFQKDLDAIKASIHRKK